MANWGWWYIDLQAVTNKAFFLLFFIYKTDGDRVMKQRDFMYEPPKVEVLEVEVEGGFAISGYGQDSDDSEFGY